MTDDGRVTDDAPCPGDPSDPEDHGNPSDPFAARAAALDAADPIAWARERFAPLDDGVIAYLDGNSLGRPVEATFDRMRAFLTDEWAGRLIRGWDDSWLRWPEVAGDRLGLAALGAAPGQVVVADSTTVLLYKLARAAVDSRPGRRSVVVDTDNFPTDRYVLEGIAAERDLHLEWITSDPAAGVTVQQVEAAVDADTALVVLSHVAYRSGWLADAAAITACAHDAGSMVLWDLSHSVGSVPIHLDEWDVDLAVGCGYKYLNGGPGAPAFAYVRAGLQDRLRQPIWGWIGQDDPFAMASGYRPAPGIRAVLSGTPPILAMVPLLASLDLLEEIGIGAVRAKSRQLTSFALELADAWLVPEGVTVAAPRDPDRRGGHITLRRADFGVVNDRLWHRGVIPDFRAPDGIRIGLAPLSTSFAEVHAGSAALLSAL